MDKYIIVTTLCNKEEIANKIIDTLLEKKLVQSPYGDKYTSACVKINDSNAGSNVQKTSPVTYSICLTDGSKGVDGDENELTVKAVNSCTCQQ